MGLFKRGHEVYVSYNENMTNESDLLELRADLHETFRESPEFIIGGKKLTIITSSMLDDKGRLIKRKAKKVIKKAKRIVKKEKKKKPQETPESTLRRLEREISRLEEQVKEDDSK